MSEEILRVHRWVLSLSVLTGLLKKIERYKVRESTNGDFYLSRTRDSLHQDSLQISKELYEILTAELDERVVTRRKVEDVLAILDTLYRKAAIDEALADMS